MNNLLLILLAAAASSLSTTQALADQLPGTLNFANVTKDRIFQTTVETSSNEKIVEFGDFDNDNDLDVAVANAYSEFGARRNKLYRNDDGVFNEVTGDPIIPAFDIPKVTRSIFMRDFTGDGWLDIYVVNNANSNNDQILINVQVNGTFSHFVDETIERLPNEGWTGASASGVSVDVDLDGDFDIFITNDPNSIQDRLYLNDGFGFFTDVTDTHLPPDSGYGDDATSADLNGDGKLDLIVSNGNPCIDFIYYNNNNNEG